MPLTRSPDRPDFRFAAVTGKINVRVLVATQAACNVSGTALAAGVGWGTSPLTDWALHSL